jgi:hypothetical protein
MSMDECDVGQPEQEPSKRLKNLMEKGLNIHEEIF